MHEEEDPEVSLYSILANSNAIKTAKQGHQPIDRCHARSR